jgi:hypothetical protein
MEAASFYEATQHDITPHRTVIFILTSLETSKSQMWNVDHNIRDASVLMVLFKNGLFHRGCEAELLRDGDSFPSREKIFCSPHCPHWFWEPSNLLWSRYRGLLSTE